MLNIKMLHNWAEHHTSKSKVKEATSLITQEFNSTLKKEEESNASALAEVETLEFRM